MLVIINHWIHFNIWSDITIAPGCGSIYKLGFTLNGQSRWLYQRGPCRFSTGKISATDALSSILDSRH